MMPSLEGLTEEQKQEAMAVAAAARRAEERAEQRALERALERKRQERELEKLQQQKQQQNRTSVVGNTTSRNNKKPISNGGSVKFVPKQQRQQQQLGEEEHGKKDAAVTEHGNGTILKKDQTKPNPQTTKGTANVSTASAWTAQERKEIRKAYLGTSTAALANNGDDPTLELEQGRKKKKKKGIMGKKAIFRFEWDDTDDTLQSDDLLYSGAVSLLNNKKRKSKMDDEQERTGSNNKSSKRSSNAENNINTKPLDKMTPRDWRIFRENYEIVTKGGRAPPPMRSFEDGNLLHPNLLRALKTVMKYREPTPIQRQAIPIGMQRRDMIGIAETGSGKTCAFGCPLIQYILQLPKPIQQRVAEQGPLALVLAPTRELALQIHGELDKLLTFCRDIICCPIVGGQNLQNQAQQLRKGVHVVVGTPGRINECIEMAYMVLNQCLYIVMDEGDRMIDMGFAPQLESILEAMGGTLKSEDEKEAYQQEEADLTLLQKGLPKHRLTAMFSATMPPEVEQMAKRYLRHPAVVSVGDQDSRKNARISQRILYLSSPAQKENALRSLVMNPQFMREKVIVFVNEKKHADGIGRMIERFGRRCVVLHGGKSQEQREENLASFRQGGVVLVATDVAGRGLDIPDVAHVINYDLPTRSIDSYNHRIGRTGRAGKKGLATSLMTDEDEGIMPALKAYLEATGNPVPDKLARHPAASGTVERNLIY
ncbi:cold-shock DEAD-box RNA helicase [Nitzschia inconspicua]|uniref:RNA helicase n=1 Tax=Nitzschia inconspicua TaxID=303405 RepID=A0A9K3KDX3_9STRA|nr:cold-shock DEAD-box RNA helicase [Nitzschia inconspicua]